MIPLAYGNTFFKIIFGLKLAVAGNLQLNYEINNPARLLE
jgi:hypothetical protein